MQPYHYSTILVMFLLLLSGCGRQPIPTQPVETTAQVEDAERQPPAGVSTDSPMVIDTTEAPILFQVLVDSPVNQVQALTLPGSEWEPAGLGLSIQEGGQVRTGVESTALLSLPGSLVRLAPDTVVTLQQLDETALRLSLAQGQVWIYVEGLPSGQLFEVETSDIVARAAGTHFSVRTLVNGGTLVSSWHRRVEVVSEGISVTLRCNQQTLVMPGEVPTEPAMMTVAEFLGWGMAQGENLAMLLPVAGPPITQTMVGNLYTPSWAWDSSSFLFLQSNPNDPDGSSEFLLIDPENSLPITQTNTGEGLNLSSFSATTGVIEAVQNPDGLTYSTWDGGYQICEANTRGSPQACTSVGDHPITGLNISPDGAWVVFLQGAPGAAQNLYRVEREAGQIVQLTSYSSGTVDRPRWSPDSQQLAYIYLNEDPQTAELWLINADGSEPRKLLDGIDFVSPAAPAWSPDGEQLAVAAREGLYLIQADGTSATLLPDTVVGIYNSLTFSPVGSGWPIYFHIQEAGVSSLFVIAGPDQPPVLWESLTSAGPYFSPDGHWAVFVSQSSAAEEPVTTLILVRLYQDFWLEP